MGNEIKVETLADGKPHLIGKQVINSQVKHIFVNWGAQDVKIRFEDGSIMLINRHSLAMQKPQEEKTEAEG